MKRAIVAAVTLSMLLTACSPAAPKRALPAAAPETTEVVTIRLDNRTPFGVDKPMLDAVIAAFQQKYPLYRVETVTPAPSNGPMDTEVAGVMQKGQADVAAVSFQNSNLAMGSVALDMYIQRDGIDVKHYGNLMTGGLVDGHNYALPFYLIPSVVGANGELLSAAGVTLPEQNWTWDGFRQVAKQTTNPLGEKPVWGVADPLIEELVRIYLEEQADRPAWEATDAELKDALAYFQTLIRTDRSIQPPKVRMWEPDGSGSGTDGGMSGAMDAFGKGLSAFYFGGYVVGIRTSGPRQYLPVPTHPGRPYAMNTWAQWLAVATGSQHPDAAWAFVKFAAGPEGAALAAKSGFLPGYMDESVQAAWFSQQPQPAPLTKAFFNTKWLLGNINGAQNWTNQRKLYRLYRLANRVMTDAMDVETALREFHKEMDGSVPGK